MRRGRRRILGLICDHEEQVFFITTKDAYTTTPISRFMPAYHYHSNFFLPTLLRTHGFSFFLLQPSYPFLTFLALFFDMTHMDELVLKYFLFLELLYKNCDWL